MHGATSPALKCCMAEVAEKEEGDYPGISHRKGRQALCNRESSLLGVGSSVQTGLEQFLLTWSSCHQGTIMHNPPATLLAHRSSVLLNLPCCGTAAALDLSERHRALQCKIGRITPFLLRGSSLKCSPALQKLDKLQGNNSNKKTSKI